jgi:hypothetical protein
VTRRKRTVRRDTIKTVAASTMPCGKVGYLTRQAARKDADAIGHKQGVRLIVYRCKDERCAGMPWHLTSGQRFSPR